MSLQLTATTIFDFLEDVQGCSVIRHEVGSAAFVVVRQAMSAIIMNLCDTEDAIAHAHAESLRSVLYECLTDPIPFDEELVQAVMQAGSADFINSRWGYALKRDFEHLLQALTILKNEENPLRTIARERLTVVVDSKADFRIFCHRKSIAQFHDLAAEAGISLGPSAFLHTTKDYREVYPFDVLIKVGSFRGRGWGCTPDAIRSAPRFKAVEQIVWMGNADESDFGYDPAAGRSQTEPTLGNAQRENWRTKIVVVNRGEPVSLSLHLDEFKDLAKPRDHGELRNATLVQVTDDDGVLYPPNAQVLTFDADEGDLGFRTASAELMEGMYVVRPLLADVDLGGVHAEHGAYSAIWKGRLREICARSPALLRTKLREAGLDLVHLHSALSHWCEPGTTVIRAPQQMRHFKILIDTLDLDHDSGDFGSKSVPWWQRAWDEIRRSRGAAIVSGMQEQSIIDEQLLIVLRNHIERLSADAAQGDDFAFVIPDGNALQGAALFNRIREVRDGFRAPESEMKVIKDLYLIEQWRA